MKQRICARLRKLHKRVRSFLNVSDKLVRRVNRVLRTFARLPNTPGMLFLGPLLCARSRKVQLQDERTFLIHPAISLPEGFGTLCWQSEQLATSPSTNDDDEPPVLFRRYESCGRLVRLCLLSHLEPLLATCLRQISLP